MNVMSFIWSAIGSGCVQRAKFDSGTTLTHTKKVTAANVAGHKQ
jgi:hypothetical protein